MRWRDAVERLKLPLTVAIVVAQAVGAYLVGSGRDFSLFREATLDQNPYVWLAPYAYWLFWPIMQLPFRVSLALLVLLSAGMMAYVGHKLSGNGLVPLITSAGFLSAETGQIDGFIALGLALGAMACERRKPHLLGGALLLMSMKPQISLLAAVWFILYLRDWRVFVVPVAVALLTLLTDGFWPLEFFRSPPSFDVSPHNLSPWRICGPALLPLLLCPFFFSQGRPRRAAALSVCASALALPYYSLYSLDVPFAVGIPPWLAPLSYLPFVSWPSSWQSYSVHIAAVVPLLALVILVAQGWAGWRTSYRARRWLVVASILFAAFVLRMVAIQFRPLWYDEAFAVLYASLHPAKIVYGTVAPVQGAGAADVHPLFYYFLLHGWMALVGRSPLAVRFLSMVLGMVTVAVLWRMAAWVFGRRTGLVVGLLAAVNPFHVAYSQEARMYALLALAVVAAAWALVRALEGGPRRWWVLYVVAAVGTLYAHNLGPFFLLAFNVLAVVRRRWRCRLLSLALADVATLALFGPWLVGVLPGQMGFVRKGYWLAAPGLAEVVRATMLPILTFYEPAPVWVLGLGLFVGMLLLVLLVFRAWRVGSRAGWFLVLCWFPIVSLLVASLWRPVYLERALLPSALFYLVAVGWLLARGGLPRPLRWGLVSALAVTMAGSLMFHYAYVGFPRPSFELLNSFLADEIGPGEVVVHENKMTYFPAHYYDPALPHAFCSDLPGTGSDTLALPTQEALGLFATPITQTVANGASGVWYVAFDRTWEEYHALGYPDTPNRAWLRDHCRQQGKAEIVADLEVYHFVACEAGP